MTPAAFGAAGVCSSDTRDRKELLPVTNTQALCIFSLGCERPADNSHRICYLQCWAFGTLCAARVAGVLRPPKGHDPPDAKRQKIRERLSQKDGWKGHG